ncbi:DUF1295 domain-containing protein [bacterium]|nr:DUF1295 domain-containing protein [bacterium]
METAKTKHAGVNRSYSHSLPQKSTFILIHLLIVIFCSYLILFDGFKVLGHLLGHNLQIIDPNRAKILLGCAAFYWLRHCITLFYLLKRRVDWSEVFGLLLFIAFFEVGLLLLGAGIFRNHAILIGRLDFLALVLLLFGSWLNSFSEIQRKWWKQDPTHQGQCYTLGLFHYSMHINYFGDVLLFCGWCLFSYNLWSLILPLFMGFSFVFFHIPALDAYLSQRYGDPFETYSKKTKKFIPFIY